MALCKCECCWSSSKSFEASDAATESSELGLGVLNEICFSADIAVTEKALLMKRKTAVFSDKETLFGLVAPKSAFTISSAHPAENLPAEMCEEDTKLQMLFLQQPCRQQCHFLLQWPMHRHPLTHSNPASEATVGFSWVSETSGYPKRKWGPTPVRLTSSEALHWFFQALFPACHRSSHRYDSRIFNPSQKESHFTYSTIKNMHTFSVILQTSALHKTKISERYLLNQQVSELAFSVRDFRVGWACCCKLIWTQECSREYIDYTSAVGTTQNLSQKKAAEDQNRHLKGFLKWHSLYKGSHDRWKG